MDVDELKLTTFPSSAHFPFILPHHPCCSQQPFKIIFGAIDSLQQQCDWIVYVLIDGHLCGSRVLIRTDEPSSCQVSGLSLSINGDGPVELEDTVSPNRRPLEQHASLL